MPILYRANSKTEEGYPGIPRTILVDASHGAESLWVGHLEIEPGATVTPHIHPEPLPEMFVSLPGILFQFPVPSTVLL